MFSNAVAEEAMLDKTKLKSVKTEIRGKKEKIDAFCCNSAKEVIDAFQ
jgi:hypothetical protein